MRHIRCEIEYCPMEHPMIDHMSVDLGLNFVDTLHKYPFMKTQNIILNGQVGVKVINLGFIDGYIDWNIFINCNITWYFYVDCLSSFRDI